MRLGTRRERVGDARDAKKAGEAGEEFKLQKANRPHYLFAPYILATPAPYFSSKPQFPPDADTLILGFNSLGVTMEVGQKVCVYRLRDRVSPAIAKKLGQIGVVQDYKITDGNGVGFLVKFTDNSATWFFEDEVRPATVDS